MDKDDLMCWQIAIETRFARFRFESEGWEFHCEWLTSLWNEFDKLPWKTASEI